MEFTVTLHESGAIKEVSDGVSYHPPINTDQRVFECEIVFSEPITSIVLNALHRCRPQQKIVELGRRRKRHLQRERHEITVPYGQIIAMSPTLARVRFDAPWRSEGDRSMFLQQASVALAAL